MGEDMEMQHRHISGIPAIPLYEGSSDTEPSRNGAKPTERPHADTHAGWRRQWRVAVQPMQHSR